LLKQIAPEDEYSNILFDVGRVNRNNLTTSCFVWGRKIKFSLVFFLVLKSMVVLLICEESSNTWLDMKKKRI